MPNGRWLLLTGLEIPPRPPPARHSCHPETAAFMSWETERRRGIRGKQRREADQPSRERCVCPGKAALSRLGLMEPRGGMSLSCVGSLQNV